MARIGLAYKDYGDYSNAGFNGSGMNESSGQNAMIGVGSSMPSIIAGGAANAVLGVGTGISQLAGGDLAGMDFDTPGAGYSSSGFWTSGAGSSWISALIGAAASIGNAVLQNHYTKKLMKYQAELNEAQAQRDYDRYLAAQKELLQLQYQLSSYSAQVQSAREAGLNVGALFSGFGGSSPSGSTGSTPTGSGVSLGAAPSGMLGVGSVLELAQAQLAAAQARKVESETPDHDSFQQNLLAQTAQRLASAGQSDASAALLRFNEMYSKSVASDNAESLRLSNENLRKQGRIMENSILNSSLDAQTKVATIHQMLLDRVTTYLKWQALQKGIEVSDAQIEQYRASAVQSLASARNLNASTAESFLRTYREISEYTGRGFNTATRMADSICGSGIIGSVLKPIFSIGLSTFFQLEDAVSGQNGQQKELRDFVMQFYK